MMQEILQKHNSLRKTNSRPLPDPPSSTSDDTPLLPEIPPSHPDEYYEDPPIQKTITIQTQPSWVTTSELCEDYVYKNLKNPGTFTCPFVFKSQTYEDVVFQINDDFKSIKFEDCSFIRSQVWGNLKNVENVRPRYTEPEYCSLSTSSVYNTPGSKENPLIFHNTTFAFLNFEMGDFVYALFKQCRFVCCRLIGFKNCTFEQCEFSEKIEKYNKTPLAFYVTSCSPHAKTSVVYGIIEATPMEKEPEFKYILNRIKKLFKKF